MARSEWWTHVGLDHLMFCWKQANTMVECSLKRLKLSIKNSCNVQKPCGRHFRHARHVAIFTEAKHVSERVLAPVQNRHKPKRLRYTRRLSYRRPCSDNRQQRENYYDINQNDTFALNVIMRVGSVLRSRQSLCTVGQQRPFRRLPM